MKEIGREALRRFISFCQVQVVCAECRDFGLLGFQAGQRVF